MISYRFLLSAKERHSSSKGKIALVALIVGI